MKTTECQQESIFLLLCSCIRTIWYIQSQVLVHPNGVSHRFHRMEWPNSNQIVDVYSHNFCATIAPTYLSGKVSLQIERFVVRRVFFGRVQSAFQYHEHFSLEVKAQLGIRLTSPCPMHRVVVFFLLSVHGEQPIALLCWVVWGVSMETL